MTMPTWFNSTVRLALYGVVGTILTILVFYKWLDPQAVPLWTQLAGQLLGVGAVTTASAALIAQRRTGEVEPTKATPRKPRKRAVKRAPARPPHDAP